MLENVVKQQTCLRSLWCTSHCSGFVEKKSISCVDCVGMSSLVLVSFIEFCLASCNDEAVNIPVIILASFPLLLVCACTLLKSCVSVKLHMCCACSQAFGCVWTFSTLFKDFSAVWYKYRYVQCGGSCTSVWQFIIFPVLLQSLNTQGCLCVRAPRCFNTSSPSLSSSGLILSECRWGQLKPPGVSSQPCHCRTKQGPWERGGARKKGGRRRIVRKAVRTKDCRKWCTVRTTLS